MKEAKLSSGKKVKVVEMSVDDIDFCNDIPEIIQEGENTIIRNLSRARTAWLRRGIEGCDDKFIKSLSEQDKTELSLKVQEYQGLGEENPSH
jgi:hypothetical protein|tara:strand:+ start:3686 stop:3961 length:276 start_codon:yes stop_codon:yes gene_type:complete